MVVLQREALLNLPIAQKFERILDDQVQLRMAEGFGSIEGRARFSKWSWTSLKPDNA